MLFGRDRKRLRADQAQALAHPIRLRILELHTKDTRRPITTDGLAAELAASGGEFRYVTVGQVAYHVARLRDAELLPASNGD